jgi:hypothetical protein
MGQQRQDSGEAGLVLRAEVLGLEEKNEFRAQLGNPVRGVPDDLGVGQPDRLVSPADPGLTVVWFAGGDTLS